MRLLNGRTSTVISARALRDTNVSKRSVGKTAFMVMSLPRDMESKNEILTEIWLTSGLNLSSNRMHVEEMPS